MFSVAIDTSPMVAGETRVLRVDGAVDPVRIEIKCFTRNPPPPGFKPCPECGSYTITSGQDFAFTASAFVFAAAGPGDGLEVTVTDAAGDIRVFRIGVDVKHPATVAQSLAEA